MNEVRIAVRQYARQPGFALTVVCSLALASGATMAVFAVVNSVFVRALPFASPERLVWVASVRGDTADAPFSLPEFMDYRSRTRTLSELAAYANWSASLAGDGITERLQGARMSANAFVVLGISPAAGRLLRDSDDRADAPAVVVLSYRLWQRHYGGAPGVVGRTVRINAQPFVVVGVLPPHFPLPLRDIDVVTPLVPDRDPLRHVRNSVNFLRLFGRLQPGIDGQQAQAELTAICRSLREQFPVEYARKQAVRVDALHEALVGGYRRAMMLLLTAVTVVLLTALANVVSLALVRANARRGELSMRMAVGASRQQLVRQLMVEALLLALVGTGLAWAVAAQATAAAMRWAPASIPRLDEVILDVNAAWFAVGVTMAVTVVLTLVPLAAVSHMRGDHAFRASTRGAIGDRSHTRVRNVLVAAEIAAALVLAVATIVLVENLRQLEARDPGFNPSGIFQARLSIPPAYKSADDVARFCDRLSERVASSPGVERIGVISVAPLSGLLATVPFTVAGQASAERDRAMAHIRAISAGYLSTVQTRVLRGRAFSENDTSDTPPVALVNRALADRFFAGGAVGQRLLIDDNNTGPRRIEIVGVVEDVRHVSLDLPPALDIYIPLRQIHADGVPFVRNNQFWMVKTASDPAAFRATFLAQLRAVDPDAAVSGTGTMHEFVHASLAARRFNVGLFAAFASTAVLLAVVGLYGLVSYTVGQRTCEIGLRMAVGATPRDVQRLILRHATILALAGAGGGGLVIAIARPLVSSVGPDVSVDPALIAATAALLIGVVLAAAWLPARRAARIDPTLALRGL